MFWLVLFVISVLLFSVLILRGEDLSYLDQPLPARGVKAPSEALQGIHAMLKEFSGRSRGSLRERIQTAREVMDELGAGKTYESEFQPLQTADLRGEWVLAPEHRSDRRILYIHGGAFFAGSPVSHRPITDRLARLTGCAVLALDYRLTPEHKRIDGIEDCRRAYRWLLDNGPAGRESASFMVVAGDSAGGNLTLSLLAWVRDQQLRQADAGIALSPATDSALDAPSLREHVSTDPLLGPAFGPLVKLPKLALLWLTWFTARIMPSDPRISPLRGSLANLPPILVQASDSEMLLDDARRYVAKAQAAESPVILQTWPDTVHVWQIFTPELEEAEEAYSRINEFLLDVGLAQGADRAA